MVERVRDTRKVQRIPPSAIFLSVFGLQALRLGSFNGMEQQLNIPARWEPWVGDRKPSADTLGYALSRSNLTPLRGMLAEAGKQAKRKKVFRRLYPDSHWVGAIDGVETYKSRKRCCRKCLKRKVKIGKTNKGKKQKKVTEYYHREVALQLIGVTPALIVDVEPLVGKDTEASAALRLLARVRKTLSRFFNVLSFDAFYLQAPFVKKVLEMGYGVVIVLKQEERDLYKDADGVFQITTPEEQAIQSQGLDGTVKVWDVDGLTSWSQLGRPVRVVRELKMRTKRERIAGKWVEREVEEDWRSVVIFPDAQHPPADTVRRWAHARWDEECRGFGELTQRWHLDHSYHHHPVARMACLLILFLAFFLTTVFFDRNLKPQFRRGKTRLHLAGLLADDLVRGGVESFWARAP